MQDVAAFQPRLGLRLCAILLWKWCRPIEPNSEELALETFVDHGHLVKDWLREVRCLLAEYQQRADHTAQLGGPGVDVELDEISFRASARRHPDGTIQVQWKRYLGVVERGSRNIVLRLLKDVWVHGAGQGGGQLSNEELHSAIMGSPGTCQPHDLLLPGTVAHTDSAKAYINICHSPCSFVTPPHWTEHVAQQRSEWLADQLDDVQLG